MLHSRAGTGAASACQNMNTDSPGIALMKRVKFFFVLASSLALLPAHAAESGEVAAEDRERIAGLFDTIEPDNVYGSPISGWYTIRKGPVVAYISTDGRYLLQGEPDARIGYSILIYRLDDEQVRQALEGDLL